MAIIPWSNAVNVGSTYAANVRGPVTAGIAIQSATWKSGAAVNISAITQAKPAVVTTSSAHGLVNGDAVYITGVKGMTSPQQHRIHRAQQDAARRSSFMTPSNAKIDTTGAAKYTSAGTEQKCLTAACEMVITTASAAWNFAQGDVIEVTGTTGLSSPTDIDGLQTVGAVTSNTFVWPDVFGPTKRLYERRHNVLHDLHADSSPRKACQYYYFTNAAGGQHALPGQQLRHRAHDERRDRCRPEHHVRSASTTRAAQPPASRRSIQPLTSNKTTLHNLAQHIDRAGSTAGHLGLAWGWYMICAQFRLSLAVGSQPAAYGRANLVKAVILMTDGQFNLQYCNGVLDSDVGSGTGNINCTSPNGNSHAPGGGPLQRHQGAGERHHPLYGRVLPGQRHRLAQFPQDCATAPSDFFQADSGTDLSNAFTAIAQNLNNLAYFEVSRTPSPSRRRVTAATVARSPAAWPDTAHSGLKTMS